MSIWYASQRYIPKQSHEDQIYLFIIGFYILPSCANISERSAGLQVWYIGPFLGFGCASDHPFVIKHQVCSLNTKPQLSTTLHYTIAVSVQPQFLCNRTAHSQHCLPASLEAREWNLKYARATGELNPGLLAECITTRPPRLQLVVFGVKWVSETQLSDIYSNSSMKTLLHKHEMNLQAASAEGLVSQAIKIANI